MCASAVSVAAPTSLRSASSRRIRKRPRVSFTGTSWSDTSNSPHFRCWVADVEVAGAGDTHKTHGAGIDGIQALYSARYLIPSMLVKYENAGRLSWLDEGWLGCPEFKLAAP
ncbi:DUF6968 family protein [Sorangium sp. So ce315]|uniref:DUF6968 family protein n=1 Tax=Sorangium sp. So ce315 TaxID=3133299 RepID=UPI003F63291D